MVAPQIPEQPLRVFSGKDVLGRTFFYDPDTGRRLSKADAVRRVTYDADTNRIRDSRGRFVGVASLRLPVSGSVTAYKTLEARYTDLTIKPGQYEVRQNEEIVERIVLRTPDGKLKTVYISHGLGNKYDPSKYGGRWRRETATALGYEETERPSTRALRAAVVDRNFQVKRLVAR